MFTVKQELTIQVSHINGIEINLKHIDNILIMSFWIIIYYKVASLKNTPELLTTVIFLNPESTKFFNSSHPIPPAPTTNIGVVITLFPKCFDKTAGAFSGSVESSAPAILSDASQFKVENI